MNIQLFSVAETEFFDAVAYYVEILASNDLWRYQGS